MPALTRIKRRGLTKRASFPTSMMGVSKVSELASAQPVPAGRSVSADALLMEIANRRLSWFGREDILDGFVDFLGFRFIPR